MHMPCCQRQDRPFKHPPLSTVLFQVAQNTCATVHRSQGARAYTEAASGSAEGAPACAKLIVRCLPGGVSSTHASSDTCLCVSGYRTPDGSQLRGLSSLKKPELLAMCKKLKLTGRGELLDLDHNLLRSAGGFGSCRCGIPMHAGGALGGGGITTQHTCCFVCAVTANWTLHMPCVPCSRHSQFVRSRCACAAG